MTTPVTVIGAGLSGLATAWYLAERGARVRVLEAASRPGGLIQTVHTREGLVETAARAFPWSDRTAALFEAMDIAPQFARDESKRRYIFRDGRARRWPLTPFETAGAAARLGRACVRAIGDDLAAGAGAARHLRRAAGRSVRDGAVRQGARAARKGGRA